MPTPSITGHVLNSVLIATVILFTSAPAHSAGQAPWVGKTLEEKECVGNVVGGGPWDYLNRAQLTYELDVIQRHHFNEQVERLEAGMSASAIADIAYVLAAWPNHHRALHSAMRYRMMNWDWPADEKAPPAECQLQRAIAFSPNDPVPHMMYGMLLHKAKKYEAAVMQYLAANRLNPNDVLTIYNAGLSLVELKRYPEAVQAAKKAYTAGVPLPGLKNKLIAAGQWPEATKPTQAEGSTAAAKEQKQESEPVETVVQNEEAKSKPTDNTTANTENQPKATKPLAEGGNQGVKTPEVTQ